MGVFINTYKFKPDINIKGNSISIVSGDVTPSLTDHTDFGQVEQNQTFVRTYTIENLGQSTLNIGPSFSTNTPVFYVSTTPAASILPNETTTLGITFKAPVTLGAATATIFVSNNDPNEQPYQFVVGGESITLQTLVVKSSYATTNFTFNSIVKSGAILDWQVSGGITIGSTNINNPVFDFTGNSGIADVYVSSTDGFSGFTELEINNKQITDTGIANLTALTKFHCTDNLLVGVPNLATNTALLDVNVSNNDITGPQMDYLIITLDGHGLSNGFLDYSGQSTGGPSSASLTAYNNLVTKGWTITGPVPA